MKNGHAWRPRLIAGLGSLVLMLGILAAFQPGMPQLPRASRPAAPARIGTVALRTSGVSASRIATMSYGAQFCYYNGGYACLNAWGGGPWVNTYTGGPDGADTNADFGTININGILEIEYTGGGAWNGECIGDAYNRSGYADTSLDSCGNVNNGGAGWGTSFTEGNSGCPTGKDWFYNNHWGGYLGPPNGWINGSHFYLNNTARICFSSTLYIN